MLKGRVRKLRIAIAALAVGSGGVVVSPAWAEGTLAAARVTPAGTFGGIDYVQYDGIFEGRTSTGAYRVPYRITAPASPGQGRRTVLVEPPHGVGATGTLDVLLGRSFVFSRGFEHASVGYSTAGFRILDPSVRHVFVRGGVVEENGRIDDEIISDFARALTDSQGRALLGRVDRRYLVGYSDSSDPALRLVESGRANHLFDLVLPITASGHDPQAALTAGLYSGKIVVVNSESEGTAASFVDRGVARARYRSYAVAGAPHISDVLDLVSSVGTPNLGAMTTPAGILPELRAHFVQADRWVKDGSPPTPSTQLLAASDGTLARDANGNAIAVDGRGQRVPRLPFVELGEAHFVVPSEIQSFEDLFGSFEQVKTIQELGFRSPNAYLKAFDRHLEAYVRAFEILPADANAMHRRASLCPPFTFTQTYRDHYDAFVSLTPCG